MGVEPFFQFMRSLLLVVYVGKGGGRDRGVEGGAGGGLLSTQY